MRKLLLRSERPGLLLVFCLAVFAVCAAQSPNPRGEIEERGPGRVPNPVVRRSNAAIRRTPAPPPSLHGRIISQVKVDVRVEQALELGNKARDEFDPDKAEEFYRKALSLDPTEYRAYVGLGNVEMDYEYPKPEDAVEGLKRAGDYYGKALALNAKDWSAHYGLGRVYDYSSDEEPAKQARAEAEYKKALALNPGVVEVWRSLGLLYEGQNRLNEAVAAMRKALSLKPQDKVLFDDIYWRLGDILEKQKRYAEAVQLFQAWSRADPKEDSPYYRLGVAYVMLGKRSEATRQHQILLQLKSQFADRLLEEINKMKD